MNLYFFYPKVFHIESIKKNGIFVNNLEQEIKAEKCGNLKKENKFLNLSEKRK